MENINPQNNMSEALNEILAMRDEIALMGANDYEMGAIRNILGRLKNGECTPTDALRETQSIKDRKSDYH